MIVTAHQPNLLPGRSVIQKVKAADTVIWLDEVQYSKGGWTNRNRIAGSWFTVPVERDTDGMAMNRVRIADMPWRVRAAKTLEQEFARQFWLPAIVEEIMRPYRLLIGLNLALLRVVLPGSPPWVFQSHLDGGHAVVAVAEDSKELLPISDRLAMMVAELGGDTYLSGPSGRGYLNEQPFHDLGISVAYYAVPDENPCCLYDLSVTV